MKLSKLASLPVIGVALCAACCAIPLIAAVGVPAAVAGLTCSPTETAVLVSVVAGALILGTVYYLRKTGRLPGAVAACSTGCGCKTKRGNQEV